jgi:hypothetical protein
MNSDNLVPDVPCPEYDDAERELHQNTVGALERDDYRTAAGLKLEQAHRDMNRRDAMLSDLVAAVLAGDPNGIQERARDYATWARWLERDIAAASEWAHHAEHSAEPQAER